MASEKDAIQRIMDGLKCTEAEAREVYEADKAIDHGERMEFDLTPEQEKEAKKFAHAGTKKIPTAYKFDKRERKANPTKGGIIAEIAAFLEVNTNLDTNSVEITNKERQIAFKVGEDCFELTLVQKRKPKS